MKGHREKRPLISVIIPAFNCAPFIEEAVHSVLTQTYDPLELIIVDDGSIDATGEILAAMPGKFEYFYQPNSGIGAARNKGVASSSGDFLAFLDSDDIWLKHKLRLQMDVFVQEPDTDVVYGHAEQFCSPELEKDDRARLEHLTGHHIPAPIPGAMLIRRRAFEQAGPFDTSLRIGVEVEWYGRLCDQGFNIVMLDDLLYRRRLHRLNTNRIHHDEQRERLLVLQRMLARRRSGTIPRNANRRSPPQ